MAFSPLKAISLFLLIALEANCSPEFSLPVARIYQVDSNNRVIKPWTAIDGNSETILENVDNVRLDCIASHPVQWIYKGNGIPAFASINKYSRKNSHGETSVEYTASVLINAVKEHNTGKYYCSPSEFIDERTFFYIYVPGQNLFTTKTSHNIILPKNDTNILIPCTVSHPRASVTLDKSEGEVLRRVKVRSSDAVQYNPREGFRLKTNKIDDPEGTYVCSARHGQIVRGVEYRVLSSYSNYNYYQSDAAPANLQKCKKQCGENAYCDIIDSRETCKCLPEFSGIPDVKCTIKCNAHTDCPSTMSCFVDRQCRNPCIHSQVGCGVNAKCRVEDHRPVCYCPQDFVGDETVQCFNTLQGSEAEQFSPSSYPDSNSRPQSSRPQKPQSSGQKCASNTDCPYTQTCIRTSSSSSVKECVDPCLTRRCGRNAECRVEDHRASCECSSGFYGDARIECGPNKFETEQYAEPLVSKQSQSQSYMDSRRPCDKPEMCGVDSECKMDKYNRQQCLCKEGYMGQPPKCRPECKQNKDCPEKHVCLSDSRVGYPSCAKICGSKVCGAHADCLELEGTFECYCPDGTFGDPLVKCETKEMHLDRDCTTDYDCGIKLRCETGADYRRCVDPCIKKECRSDFTCKVDNHVANCVCAPGFTGNAYVGCVKNPDAPGLVSSRMCNLTCGQNSECRISNGEPKCFCQSGYIGRPPACIAECFSNSDCPSNLSCVQKRCRHICTGCGKNTKCRVSSNSDRSSICSCIDGFEGNPYVECSAIHYN